MVTNVQANCLNQVENNNNTACGRIEQISKKAFEILRNFAASFLVGAIYFFIPGMIALLAIQPFSSIAAIVVSVAVIVLPSIGLGIYDAYRLEKLNQEKRQESKQDPVVHLKSIFQEKQRKLLKIF